MGVWFCVRVQAVTEMLNILRRTSAPGGLHVNVAFAKRHFSSSWVRPSVPPHLWGGRRIRRNATFDSDIIGMFEDLGKQDADPWQRRCSDILDVTAFKYIYLDLK